MCTYFGTKVIGRNEIEVSSMKLSCYKSQARREFCRLAWPSALEGLAMVLLSSADLIMVGALGFAATSAVGIFSQPKMVLLCFPRSFSIAVTARVALLRGRGELEEAPACMKQSLLTAASCGALLAALAWAFLTEILLIAGAQTSYLEAAVSYGKPMIISTYMTTISATLQGGLLGMGRTKAMLAANVAGNIMNVAANALLIYGLGPFPRLGVAGAGWGTVVGSALTLLLTAAALCEKGSPLSLLGRGGWLPERENMRALWNVFSGTLTEQSAERVGMFLYSRIAAGLGEIPFAIHTICMNLCDIYYCFAGGMGKASLSLSGYLLGRGGGRPFALMMSESQKTGFAVSCAAFVLYAAFRGPLASLWISEPEAAALCEHIIVLVAFVGFPEAQSLIASGILRGAGDTRYVAAYSVVSIAIIRPIVTWTLCCALGLGLYGAWAALFLDQTTRAACATVRLRKKYRVPS